TGNVDLRGDVGVRVVHARLQFVQRHLNGQFRPCGLEILDGALHYVLSTRAVGGRVAGDPRCWSGRCLQAREKAYAYRQCLPSYLPGPDVTDTWLQRYEHHYESSAARAVS